MATAPSRARAPQNQSSVVVSAQHRRDRTIDAVIFVVGSRSEEQRVGWLIVEAVAECHPPQSVELQRTMIPALELALKFAGCEIERVDRAVAEIADQKIVREFAERARRERHAPGRIEPAATREAANEIAVRVELIDDAEARSCCFVVLVVLAFRVCHEQMAVDVLDVERRESLWEVGIGKS